MTTGEASAGAARPESPRTFGVSVNGVTREVSVPVTATLLSTLRRELGCTSVREVCGVGICGACTVLLDGRAVSSCLLLTAQAEGREVVTPEGLLDDDGRLSRVQQAFVDRGAYQCSFCIPAMALTVHASINHRKLASTEEVREELGGNLCRCGSYPQVLEVVRDLLGEGHATERGADHDDS